VKGLGYALEAMVAITIIVLFGIGAVQVDSPDHNWSEYQKELAVQDITFSMQSSGKIERFIQRGEVGSLQSYITEVSDRDMEVSGEVSGLPLTDISIGYYAKEKDRHEIEIEEASLNLSCKIETLEDEFGDIEEDSIYKTRNTTESDLAHESNYGVNLYFANTTETKQRTSGYDALWVDNSTSCEFSENDGPFNINDMFHWADEDNESNSSYYEFKKVDIDEETAHLYNATKAHRLKNQFKKDITGISTEVSLDIVDFDEVQSKDFTTLIFSESASLQDMDQNKDIVKQHMNDGSVLLLVNPSEAEFEESIILNQSNLEWMNVDYKQSYSSKELTNATFSSREDSLSIETFYRAQKGDVDGLRLNPPGKLISNYSIINEPVETVYSEQESYDIQDYRNVYIDDFEHDAAADFNPTNCVYDEESDLTEAENVNVGDLENNFDVINVGLDDDCNERGLVFNFGEGYDSRVYVHNETILIGDTEYRIVIENACSEYKDGGCAELEAIGNKPVELMPHTDDSEFGSNNQMAALGYREEYDEEQLMMITSTIYWLELEEYEFKGLKQQSSLHSSAKGGLYEDGVYIPYEINLRWSE